MPHDIEKVRAQFPALGFRDAGRPRIYFDNPGGTQVPQQVLDRMRRYLIEINANHGGVFHTSIDSDALLEEAHQAMADFLGASSYREIVFGPNMTTLTFAISRSLAHRFKPGDEIILSRMDHDANVAPWLLIARDHGLTVKWLDFDISTYRYDLDQLETLLSERTRFVAVCYASNAIGTINDVQRIASMVHAVGGLVFVDAVQYVPHAPTDVSTLECDFFVCSAYKFFGPHQGILWGRREELEALKAYKVRPASDELPFKFETGTPSHEGQAGTLGAIEYLELLGTNFEVPAYDSGRNPVDRRRNLLAAMSTIVEYEHTLSAYVLRGLQQIAGLTIHGITDPERLRDRVPTISFTMEGISPEKIARTLAGENIFVWHGHYYAIEVVRRLGLLENGGMLRVGLVHYNTIGEIDRMLEVLSRLSSSQH